MPQKSFAERPTALHSSPYTAELTIARLWLPPLYEGVSPVPGASRSGKVTHGLPDSARTQVSPDTITVSEGAESAVPGSAEFPEIYVRLGAQSIGSIELSAYKRYSTVYLPIAAIFDFVKVSVALSPDLTTASGFYLHPDIEYECDFSRGIIVLDGEDFFLTSADFIIGEHDVFLADHVFSEVFGIHFQFDEMNMFISLRSDKKLPAVRAREREIARQYLDSYTGTISKVDMYLTRERSFLSGAMVDWSLNYNQTFPKNALYSYSAGLGGEFAGGDFSARVYGVYDARIEWDRMPWHWRYVNDDWSALKQITVGDVSTLTPGLYRSLRGIQLTNVPYVERRSFSKHVIEDVTFPGWEVELYMNDRLIEYVQTDSTGMFHFEIPISYGTTNVTLKYYGPHGEERADLHRIDIPFFMLPAGEYEYTITGGELNTYQRELYGQVSTRLGISSHFTVGAGMQYSEQTTTPDYVPFGSLTARFNNNMLFNADYLYKQYSRGTFRFISYEFPDLQFSYTLFDQDPLYNPLGIKYERRGSILITPPRTWFVNGLSFGIQEQAYKNRSLVYGNAGISFYLWNLFTTASTRIGWKGAQAFEEQSYHESTVSAYYPLPWGIFISSSLEYDHDESRIRSYRASLNKRLFSNLRLSLLYNKIVPADIATIRVSLSLDLPFSQLASQGTSIKDRNTLQSSVSGTFGIDTESGAVLAGNRSWIERSGISVVPFFDENNNDQFDDDERLIKEGTNARLSGVARRRFSKTSFTRFVDLLPYHTYKLNIDQNTFEDPMFSTQYKTFAVTVDPNQFKSVYLPVFVAGSVEGSIFKQTTFGLQPQSSVRVFFEHMSTGHIYETVSFGDGTFFLFGLRPGEYRASLDTVQLNSISLRYSPHYITFDIQAIEGGDSKSGLRFVLEPPYKIAMNDPGEREIPKPDTSIVIQLQRFEEQLANIPPSIETVVRSLPQVPLNESNALLVDLERGRLDSTTCYYLDRVAKTIKSKPKLVVTVHGHSDNFGTFAESQRRSEIRAELIKRYLMKRGIPESAIYTRGFGSRRPAVQNTNAENRRRNNRVEVQIIQIDDEGPNTEDIVPGGGSSF